MEAFLRQQVSESHQILDTMKVPKTHLVTGQTMRTLSLVERLKILKDTSKKEWDEVEAILDSAYDAGDLHNSLLKFFDAKHAR